MEALIKESVLAEVTAHFQALKSIIPLRPIRSESDYDFAVTKLNQLLDSGAADGAEVSYSSRCVYLRSSEAGRASHVAKSSFGPSVISSLSR